MDKSFMRKMVEEKGLEDELLKVTYKGVNHLVEMDVLLDVIENTSAESQAQINDTLSIIDFRNGRILDFLNSLAHWYISELY